MLALPSTGTPESRRPMIYLLRHGETHWNRAGRLQGQQDSPLTLRGVEQARANGERLRALLGDPEGYEMVASPLGRAWQSAAIIAEVLGLADGAIRREPRLKEIGFGAWEGLTVAEIEARHGGEWARRRRDRWNHVPPGGESFARLAARSGAWLAELKPQSRVIAVCHGGTSRVLRGRYAGLPPEETIDLADDHSSFWRLTEGVVQEFDDTSAPP